jgi:hypothetical protein
MKFHQKQFKSRSWKVIFKKENWLRNKTLREFLIGISQKLYQPEINEIIKLQFDEHFSDISSNKSIRNFYYSKLHNRKIKKKNFNIIKNCHLHFPTFYLWTISIDRLNEETHKQKIAFMPYRTEVRDRKQAFKGRRHREKKTRPGNRLRYRQPLEMHSLAVWCLSLVFVWIIFVPEKKKFEGWKKFVFFIEKIFLQFFGNSRNSKNNELQRNIRSELPSCTRQMLMTRPDSQNWWSFYTAQQKRQQLLCNNSFQKDFFFFWVK